MSTGAIIGIIGGAGATIALAVAICLLVAFARAATARADKLADRLDAERVMGGLLRDAAGVLRLNNTKLVADVALAGELVATDTTKLTRLQEHFDAFVVAVGANGTVKASTALGLIRQGMVDLHQDLDARAARMPSPAPVPAADPTAAPRGGDGQGVGAVHDVAPGPATPGPVVG